MEDYQTKLQDEEVFSSTLIEEIDKVEKLKKAYAMQKQQIQSLRQKVDHLQQQNRKLQKSKQQLKSFEGIRQSHKVIQQQSPEQQSDRSFKIQYQKQKAKLRFLSPQNTSKMMEKPQIVNKTLKTNDNLKYFNSQKMNKNVLSNLIEELRQDILKKDDLLRKQKRNHAYTKKQLERYKIQLDQYENCHNNQLIMRLETENQQLKKRVYNRRSTNVEASIKNNKGWQKLAHFKAKTDNKIEREFQKMDKIYQQIVQMEGKCQ